ncbi:hypothetical protein ONZ45_g9763 [Pleurotus djamor]|nr:hypothetical protein ONZ45_g9763 [Pleurotus djamor]
MSYAKVAAENAPSPADQPRPDPGLLNTAEPSSATVLDDTKKVNLVHPSLKDAPVTETSISRPAPDSQALSDDDEGNLKPNKSKTNRSRRIQEVEAEGAYLWQLTKQYLFRPGVAGGLIGLGNSLATYALTDRSC